MNRKLFIIYGIILMMLMTTIPVLADSKNSESLGRTHIRAIGTFTFCEEEKTLNGHIFIGIINIKPVYNLDITICEDSIKRIVMSSFSIAPEVYFYLNCVIIE